MTPKLLYFDLGNVLLRFDYRRAARQMAQLAGAAEAEVWRLVFVEGLEFEHEAGRIDDRQFHEAFCERTRTNPPREALLAAGSDIFELNVSIVPVVTQLAAARRRLGILSNTSPPHWAHCTSGRYGILPGGFSLFALSFELGALKPEPVIYSRAAALAGCAAEEIFFVDDRADNVAAAREAGFDAVQYLDTPRLAADLRHRGVRFNY